MSQLQDHCTGERECRGGGGRRESETSDEGTAALPQGGGKERDREGTVEQCYAKERVSEILII